MSNTLTLPQVAFLRSVIHGVDPGVAFERYLCLAYDLYRIDERVVRRKIREIKEECARIALRSGKPGTARLLRLTISGIATPVANDAKVPTIDEFREQNWLDDFSEAEVLAAWKERYGKEEGAQRLERRQRLIDKQLAALREIEELHARKPALSDPVETWFSHNIAQRLKAHDIPTLFALQERMRKPNWFSSVSGIGELKAHRLREFMLSHGLAPQESSALEVISKTAMAVSPVDATHSSVSAALEIALSSGGGQASVLGVDGDGEALRAFLSAYQGNTLRAYRKEIERLVLWCAFAARKSISKLTREDLMAYRDFLLDPQPRDIWCAPRHIPKSSSAWRPLEGPLSESSVRLAMTALGKLYSFLAASGHIAANPCVHMPKMRQQSLRQQFGSHVLTPDDMTKLREVAQGEGPAHERLSLLLDILYACGLRISEVASLRFADCMPFDGGWLLQVVGKGQKFREVPLPNALYERAEKLALERGCARSRIHEAHLIGPIGSLGHEEFNPYAGLSALTLARLVKQCAERAARSSGDPHQSKRLRNATAHWLRHSHASHALEAGVDLAAVQANLGHASLSTTSVYVSVEQKRRMQQMQQFWKQT